MKGIKVYAHKSNITYHFDMYIPFD